MSTTDAGALDPVAELLHYDEQHRLPKAFAVSFADLGRWDPPSFQEIVWEWDDDVLQPIGSVLRRRKEKVDLASRPFESLQPVTIHFDGSVSKRELEPGRSYTMDLYDAYPGDIVVAKIDLKNGAVGIIPENWSDAVFTNHFAIYEPDTSKLDREYFALLIQARFFRDHLWRNKVGAEGRKEVKIDFFEGLRVPLPSLDVQRHLVAYSRAVQVAASEMEATAAESEGRVAEAIYELLGTPIPNLAPELPRVMAIPSAEMGRWTFFHLARKQAGLIGFQTSTYPVRTLGSLGVETANGRSIKPTTRETPYRVLKLNALTPAGLDTTAAKPVLTTAEIAERFSINAGDLLLCRSIGSFDQIAKCAIVKETDPTLLFPDIMIRVSLPDTLDARYVREVIETPLGRSFFQTYARTAVGMWKIGAEDIQAFPIPVPPLDVQAEVVQTVDALRAEAARLRAEAVKVWDRGRAEVELMILGRREVPALA